MSDGSSEIKQESLTPVRKTSLRRTILLLLGGVLLASLIFMSGGVVYSVVTTEEIAWQNRQREAALRAAETVELFLDRVDDSLAIIGSLDRDLLETQPQLTLELLRQNPALLEIVRTDANGHVFASATRDEPLLTNLFTIPQSNWFLRAAAGHDYMGGLQISAADEPYLIIARPAPDQGVIAARLRMTVLWDVIADLRFGRGGTTYVLDATGKIVGHTDPRIPMGHVDVGTRPEIAALLAAPDHAWQGSYRNFDGRRVVGLSVPVLETDWIVVTELPQAEAYAASRAALLHMSLGVLVISLLLIFTISHFLQRLIFQPLENLRAGVQQIGQGDLAHRIRITRGDEIGQVAATFNEMATQLQERDAQLAEQTDALRNEIEEREQAQLELQLAQAHLEKRVRDRTEALASANESLRSEIRVRQQAENRIRTSLEEKEVMLKEIHHRVKNNLQVIASMLSLQAGYVEDVQALTVFQDSQNRVEAMAAIHEKLYQSENLARIDFADYAGDLAETLIDTYDGRRRGLDLESQVENLWLDVNTAVPVGLILNELVSNALKHGFPDGRSGHIKVQARLSNDDQACLCVVDDGVGFPEHVNFRETTSLGMQLVNTLIEQIRGEIELTNHVGTEFHITFPI